MKYVNKSEFYRKIIHLLNVVIPLIHIYLFKDKTYMLIFLSIILIFCFFVEISRTQSSLLSTFFKNYLFSMMRDSEKKGQITGATWVIVGALLTILLIPKPFCLLALFFLAIGDTFAALVGLYFPFIKIGRKTLSGSIACFVTCCIIGFSLDFGIDSEVIFLGASIATLSELGCGGINDNLSIPISSGLSMYLTNILV